jgi:hypothetical protein
MFSFLGSNCRLRIRLRIETDRQIDTADDSLQIFHREIERQYLVRPQIRSLRRPTSFPLAICFCAGLLDHLWRFPRPKY